MRTHDFVNSIKVGEFGEQIIKKYLLQKDNILLLYKNKWIVYN